VLDNHYGLNQVADRQAGIATEHHNPGAASSKMKRLMATCTLLLGAII